jgi:hypothetical protein
MSLVLQVIVVAVVVSACALFSVWRLLSGAARQRTLDLLARVPALAAMRWFARLQARTRANTGVGCGSCAASTSAASRKQTPGGLPR